MNKLLTISLILLFSLLMLQCEEDTRPKVAFTLSSSNVAVGEQVQFNNNTEGADSYHWYFGDGEESTQENPTHSYNTAGIYLVSLIAKKGNANGAGYATIFVGQISSTLGNLKLTYREEGTENLIPNCQVTLFLNQSDLENNINAVAEGFTDENGEILFENLEPGNYYVKAFKHEGSTTWDNAGLNNVVTVVAGEQANYVGYAAVIFQKRFVIYNQIFTDIQVTIGGETKIAPPQEAVDFFFPETINTITYTANTQGKTGDEQPIGELLEWGPTDISFGSSDEQEISLITNDLFFFIYIQNNTTSELNPLDVHNGDYSYEFYEDLIVPADNVNYPFGYYVSYSDITIDAYYIGQSNGKQWENGYEFDLPMTNNQFVYLHTDDAWDFKNTQSKRIHNQDTKSELIQTEALFKPMVYKKNGILYESAHLKE